VKNVNSLNKDGGISCKGSRKMAVKVLFVCSANVSRSRTAEDMFKGREGLEVKSAGTRWTARNRVNEEMIDWADKIFAMEKDHKDYILEKNPEAENKIVVLDIPDVYGRRDPQLMEVILMKIEPHLEAAREIKKEMKSLNEQKGQ